MYMLSQRVDGTMLQSTCLRLAVETTAEYLVRGGEKRDKERI